MTGFKVGAHVSVAGGVENAIEREEEYGGNCGQIFVGSPRTWSVADYDDAEADAFRAAVDEADQHPYVVHSTYLINLATPKDDLFEKSTDCLESELESAAKLGIEYFVFHPGAHTGSGRDNGIERVAEGIDEIDIPDSVTLLLENTAGKGTTLGKTFDELDEMIQKAETDDDSLGVCIDTCHAHAAGYDLADPDGFAETVEAVEDGIGLDKVEVLHLNDSKDPLGSEKDNHQHIGEGEIGDDGFSNLVNSDVFEDLPMILETPVDDDKGYADNIQRIRQLRE
ncbi:MAG: deoxyribonuclease IV [Halobacteria archaeon]|nr:deoxyribonuclease IV [Halobacteria archaeon]